MSKTSLTGAHGKVEGSAGGPPRTRAHSVLRIAGAAVTVAMLTLALSVVDATQVGAQPATCAASTPGGPIFVTPDCVDPLYNQPVIDSVVDLTTPVPHRQVSGHFVGTEKRFNIYLPPAEQWEGRFFHSVYPLDSENASDTSIAFGADSGAYTVQTNGGGGYRVDAAAAQFSRTVAADYYGTTQRIYGYIYGASGGSFQTIGAMENTAGIWDGAVPIVNGVPTSIPNNFFVRAFARFVLEDKAPLIADAMSPGGSGDPFAGLDAVEAAVLLEVTRMGVPLRAWEDYRYVLGLDAPDGLLGFAGVVMALDPTYVDDFWTQPGYLGTEQSPLGDMFRAALAAGGDRWQLALLSYHRHQVPTRPGFYPFDQFRDAAGQPIYPQRPFLIGDLISRSVTGGGTFTGEITGKMIVVDNLLDTDAFPWHGDWYAAQVRQALGERGFRDNFRIWFNDNADHLSGPVVGARTNRLVSYDGIVQQALRDVAAWAEDGITPPRSTSYDVNDSQVSVRANAAVRGGVQPVVDLTVRGGRDRVEIAAGQTVNFHAKVQTPPNTGEIVSLEWNFLGDATYTPFEFGEPKRTVVVQASFTYTTPGTYYVALRATSQREGDPTTPFARVQNLGRLRVVVR